MDSDDRVTCVPGIAPTPDWSGEYPFFLRNVGFRTRSPVMMRRGRDYR